MKICANIIIYNTEASKSIAFSCLKNMNISVCVYDNSVDSNLLKKNKLFCSEKKVLYFTQHANIGIAKAYNYCVDKLVSKYDWLLFFDQDTWIPFNFVENLKPFFVSKEFFVLCPIVYSNRQKISPASKIGPFVFKEKYGRFFNLPLTCINSGICISSALLKKYIFNKDLFLDFVDHDFFNVLHKNKIKVGVVANNILKQNFFFHSKPTVKNYNHRLIIFEKDAKTYYSYWYNTFFYYMHVFLKNIKNKIKRVFYR